ncbi:unnamed protein product [Candidula unifasciata]|uniref:CARD domain-containing protein n=1 Tax=Candidula unifasciata TaxID=100452 RepID=A0A8S3ZBC8_9EUPU|nr:unnamed protein product [Candidula unifasciata]
METNVAVQHAPEKWAAGEALYEQPEKVTYIYGCQKKVRESRGVARVLVKPSKSYDNQLESAVGRDVDSVGSKVKSHRVRDDLSPSVKKRPAQICQGAEDIVRVSGHTVLERQTARPGNPDSRCDDTVAYSRRYHKTKPKSSELSHQSKHTYGLDFEQLDSRFEDFPGEVISNPFSSKKRSIPVEFHLTEDQRPTTGPTVHLKRPINLSSPCSLTSSFSREKPSSSLVILEIKDGPTFFYKPSDHMLSDVEVGDEMARSSHGYFSSGQAAAGYASPHTSGSFLKDLSKTSSTSAYKGSLSFSNMEKSPYSPLRKDSLTGSRNMSPVSIGAAGASLEETALFRSNVSYLPKTAGLRKPDLSVLSTAHKSRALSHVDNDSSLCDVHKCKRQRTSLIKEPVPPVASIPISTTYTVLPSTENLHEIAHEPSTFSKQQTSHNINSNDSKQTAADLVIDVASPNPSQNSADSLSATKATSDVSCGFHNISEILQQKAGIKHDDIIVGPRPPTSGVYQDDLKEAPATSFPSENFDFHFLSPEQVTKRQKDQAGLSLSTDVLSAGHPRILLKAEVNRRKHTQSESEVPHVEMSTGNSQSKYSDLRNNLNQRGNRDNCTSAHGRSHNVIVDELAAEPVMSLSPVAVNAYGATENWRQHENKPEVQRSQPEVRRFSPEVQRFSPEVQSFQSGKVKSGHTIELRSKVSNLALLSETTAPYSTKSLDRNLKHLLETKHASRSENTSPAKQQHFHSRKSKSSLPTPIKKHTVGSKLHMLSNIPVPICHDPPVRIHSWQQSPSTPEHGNVTASEKDSKSSVGNLFPKLEPEDTITTPLASQVSSAFSNPLSPVEPAEGSKKDRESTLRSNELLKTPNIAPFSCLMTMVGDGSVKQQSSNTLDSEDTTTPKAAIISDASTSSTMDCIVQQAAQSLSKTPTQALTHLPTHALTHIPIQAAVKPRLHRSAEHLLVDTQLTVFNSVEHVLHFEHSESSSNRTFQDSPRLETAESDSISPLKKNQSLAKTGIMRRGSDRAEMYRRGSERAILPINQNDPSVEDLMKATSLKELCQSMASLLNIDNVKAAEMITTGLSQRQDLVEGLDADAILDYLSHHGVLDPVILVGLDDKASITQRNSAILRHVEEHGNTAVALFINALRQSGQLHLASSLDTEQRIQPVSGSGYFGKDRHKGELTIKIEIESLKIIAPREPRSEKIVDTSLLGTPGRQKTDDSGVVVKDASDEEDFVKPRSCWCFCFSYKSKIKSISKKDTEKERKHEMHKPSHQKQSSSPEKFSKPAEEQSKDTKTKPHRTKSQEKNKKLKENSTKVSVTESSKKDIGKSKDKHHIKKPKVSKSKWKVSGKHPVTSSVDASQPSVHQAQRVSDISGDYGAPKMTLGLTAYTLQSSDTSQPQPYVGFGGPFSVQGPQRDKESWDPIIMEYDPKLELIKLRAGQEELASPTRQSGNIGIMCEQWKSNGRHFQQKASLLCERIVQVVQNEIIRYFEQDRGTLVLDVVSGMSSILVINICMKRAQVKRLQQEIADKSLLTKMEDMFFSRVNISDFDIRGVSLRIVLDEQEVNTVLSELS